MVYDLESFVYLLYNETLIYYVDYDGMFFLNFFATYLF